MTPLLKKYLVTGAYLAHYLPRGLPQRIITLIRIRITNVRKYKQNIIYQSISDQLIWTNSLSGSQNTFFRYSDFRIHELVTEIGVDGASPALLNMSISDCGFRCNICPPPLYCLICCPSPPVLTKEQYIILIIFYF